MPGPAASFAREVAAVDTATVSETGEYVHSYHGRLDGNEVRFVVLAAAHAEKQPVRAAFERAGDRWAQSSAHEAVVSVCARGERPRPWLAVERVDGERLAAVAPELSAAAVRSVVADAAEALHGAARTERHGAGLTPSHVWVCGEAPAVTGRIDWGVDRACRVADGGATPSPYTAPELAGDPAAETATADVYTLGAITDEAVTGVVRDSAAQNGGPQPASASEPSLPAEFDAVLSRALAADPRERYSTPYEFKLAVLFETGQSNGSAAGTATQQQSGGSDRKDRGDGKQQMSQAGEQREVAGRDPGGWLSTRRAALGVLGLAAGGGALVAARQLGDSDGGSSAVNGPTDTGRTEPPDATFDFRFEFDAEPESGLLTIVHTGGERLKAGNLVVRSDALAASPLRWSDTPVYDEADAVVPGDSLVVGMEPPFSVAVFWELDGRREELDGWEMAEEMEIGPPSPAPAGPPSASFSIEYADGVVTVSHEEGDTVQADSLQFRGSGFSGEPAVGWSDVPDLHPERAVEPGDRIRLNAADDVVVHLLWTTGEGRTVTTDQNEVLSESGPAMAAVDRQAVLAQYYGPGRPLDTAAGGVETGRYDAANTGFGAGVTGPRAGVTGQWTFQSRQPTTGNLLVFGAMAPSPAVVNGVVYAGSTDGALYAVDAEDGAELWRREAGAFSSATVSDRTVYVGGENLLALDPVDGSLRWRIETGEQVVGPPRVVDGTVYAASGDPMGWTLRAVDAEGGELEWVQTADVGVVRPPAVADGRVYLSGQDVRALDAASGQVLWTAETSGRPTAPVVADGTVYVGEANREENEGAVTALDGQEGTARWRRTMFGPVFAAVSVADGVVYTAGAASDGGTVTGGFLTAVDAADSTLLMHAELDTFINYPPTVADGTVYLADEGNHVIATDAANGAIHWTQPIYDDVRGPPVAADGRLFVAGEQQSLHVLEESGQ